MKPLQVTKFLEMYEKEDEEKKNKEKEKEER